MPGDTHHPLFPILTEAALGRPPAVDGLVEIVPPAGGTSAIVAFTAHHVILGAMEADVVRSRLPADDLGAPTSPAFQLFFAGWVGAEPGVIDVVLARPAAAMGIDLVPRDDLSEHPRVQRAASCRTDLSVWTDASGDGVLVIGRGLAGRWEMAFEVEPSARGRGLGRALAQAAATRVPEGEIVFAQVSPGHSASLRAVLAAGYTPIGSEVLFTPTP